MWELIKSFFGIYKKVDISKKPIPCLSCGACCSYFNVGFKREVNQQVPFQSIAFVKKEYYMKGTEKFKGRCSALVGKVGETSICSIYQNRPNVCDLFPVWLPNGKQNRRCFEAREYHGLPGKIEE